MAVQYHGLVKREVFRRAGSNFLVQSQSTTDQKKFRRMTDGHIKRK